MGLRVNSPSVGFSVSGRSGVGRVLSQRISAVITGVAAAGLSGVVALAGVCAITSSASGALAITKPIAGLVSISSSSTGQLAVIKYLSGAATITSSASGSISTSGDIEIAGSAAITSGATGALAVSKPLAGTASLTSSASGSLSLAIPLAGTSSITSGAAGSVRVTKPMAGTSAITSNASGGIAVTKLLAGAAAITSGATGALTVAGAGGDPIVTPLATKSSSTDSSTYSFTSTNLGTATSDRKILVAIAANCGGGVTDLSVSSVTVAGVSATQAATSESINAAGTGSHVVAHWIAEVPTGTSGTIAITFSASVFRVAAHVYGITDSATTPTASRAVVSLTASDVSAMDLSLNVGATSVVIGTHMDVASSEISNTTWVGLTEDYDSWPEGTGVRVSSASHKSTGAETPRTITAQPTGGTTAFRNGLVTVWD